VTTLPAPDRWRLIAPILEEALELPPERRGAFLAQACGGDAGLRAEVEALLSADSQAGAFLDAPIDLSALDPPPDDDHGSVPESPSGTTIGPYRVIREIGRGGMGVVYEAEQKRPRRPVALKVILGGRHVDAEAVRMFQRETDSLARLKHPSIAAIYESGSTEEGQHYFAMELVQGRSLSDVLEEKGAARSQADVRLRLVLFRKICAAVAYAHQRGVIHLDLKPSNILVLEAPGGDAPEIKVLDFGLARITDPEAGGATAVTAFGRIQGTLPYMSPEQIRGRRDEVDVRSDVYALGVILYRMLTGRLPYDLEGREITEAARIVCEEAPRPLRSAAGGEARFDHDLTVVTLKALEKEPARRYSGVAALEEDVARYLDGRPILARPPSALYQIRKLVVRHKIPFAAAAALLVLLVGFAVAMTLQARRIAAERDRANREATTALRVSDFLTDLFKVSDPNEARGNAITAREILDKGVAKIGDGLAGEPEVQARLMLTVGNVYWSLGLYREAGPILEKSVEMRRRLFGDDNLDTLASMEALAFDYQSQGRASDAEPLYMQIIERRRRLQGEDHEDTLKAMNGLAWVYRLQGRFTEEERLHRQVFETRRRILGDEHRGTLQAAADLGGSISNQRRYVEAEAILRPTLETERRVLGKDHPMTLGGEFALADALEGQRHMAEAETLLRDALGGMRRVLGPDHNTTLSAENDLATLCDHAGRYPEAERLYRDTLERRRRVLGDDHPETLSTISNLANMASVQGRYKEAETLLREALDRQRRLFGDKHPDTVSTLYNLGCTAALRGDRTAALGWLDEAVTNGWQYADQLAKDDDLKSLRGSPAFEALVARARKNAGK
jgi:eukaryotic-like serine/threonine-protein kinase